jgi:AcrR family transcriptional regulator
MRQTVRQRHLCQGAIRPGCPNLDKERGLSRQPDGVRVRRTRKLLREALIELIGKRGFDRITVGELTETALVSRAAFYRNYRDKYDLAEQIFDEALASLIVTLPEGREERWVAFFEHIAEYDRLYGTLLSTKSGSWFADKMRTELGELSGRHLPAAAAGSMTPTILGAMFVQAISWWLAHGQPTPPAEIAAHTARLAQAVITAEL